ncbi:SCW11 [Brettanomyces bruxellensis]|uniref:DEBR0S6_06788g1_1 n=1 Tax=Dekkera bruxellensis TaxID=5007 RepID=A0A7D9D1M9_DEKBR|nr:SCW11 [Brettanomyces bruxellensis]
MLFYKALLSLYLFSGVTHGLPLPLQIFQKRNAAVVTKSGTTHVDTITDINIVTITATSCPEDTNSVSTSSISHSSSAEANVLVAKDLSDTSTLKTITTSKEATSTSVVSVIVSDPDATDTPDDGLVHIVNVVSHPGALFRATSVDDPITTTYTSTNVPITTSTSQEIPSNYVVVSSTGTIVTYATSATSSTLSNGSVSKFITSSIVSSEPIISNVASSVSFSSINSAISSSIVTNSESSDPVSSEALVADSSSASLFPSLTYISDSIDLSVGSANIQTTTLQTSTTSYNKDSTSLTQDITSESSTAKVFISESSTEEESLSDSSSYQTSTPVSSIYEAATSSSSTYEVSTTSTLVTSSTTDLVTSTSSSTSESSSSSGIGYVTGHPVTIVYSPYTNDSGCKSYDTVYSDLSLIKSKQISEIRVYGNDCNYLTTVLPIAAILGLKVNQGFWISSDGVDSIDSAVSDLISSVTSGNSGFDWSLFSFITIGNEAIISDYCTVDELISKIASVKSQLRNAGYDGLVTTSEPPVTFEENPTLCTDSEIDFVGINPHSYFDVYASADTSGDFVKGQIEIVQGVCPGMDVVVTETGYPSAGITNGKNVPSPLNQKIAIQNIFDIVGTNVTILTTFNDYWKQPGNYGIEQSFGIIQLLQ